MSIRFEQRVIPKVASYTVRPLTNDQSGTIFTNRGATGAITFTLPTPTASLKGVWYEFRVIADQNVIVASAANKVVTFNNAAATSLACQTGGQLIGGRILAKCDGTSWLVSGAAVAHTYTVA